MEYQELLTNMLASLAAANFMGNGMMIDEMEHQNSESAFNHACVNLPLKNFSKSRDLLMIARKFCENDQTLLDELTMIDIQMIYLELLNGNVSRACEIAEKISNLKDLKDPTKRIMWETNWICLRKDRDFFEIQRRLKQTVDETLINRLPTYQREVILFNHALLSFHMDKSNVAREEILRGQQNSKLDPIKGKWLLLACAVLLKERKMDEAVELMRNELAKNPNSMASSMIPLGLAELLLRSSTDIHATILTLQSIPNAIDNYGIVRALLACCDVANDPQAARLFLDESMKAGKLKWEILREYARFLYRHHYTSEAMSIYDQLIKMPIASSNTSLIAEAIQAYAPHQPTIADRLSLLLPSEEAKNLPFMLSKSEIDTLENLPTYKSGMVTRKTTTTQPILPADTKTMDRIPKPKPKAHKKRKNKPAKNYDPNKLPDPERWIPRHLRSSYRIKQEKRSSEKRTIREQPTKSQTIRSPLDKSPTIKSPTTTSIRPRSSPASSSPPLSNIKVPRK
jgi:signal recognition particle subunit SRP72